MKGNSEKNKYFTLIRNMIILISILCTGFYLAYNYFEWDFMPKNIFTNYDHINLSENIINVAPQKERLAKNHSKQLADSLLDSSTYSLIKSSTDSLLEFSTDSLMESASIDSVSPLPLINPPKKDADVEIDLENNLPKSEALTFKEVFLSDQELLHQAIMGSNADFTLSKIIELIAIESQSFLISNSSKNAAVLNLIASTNLIQNMIIANHVGTVIYSTDQKLLGQDVRMIHEDITLQEPKMVWTSQSPELQITSFPLYHSYGFLGRVYVYLNQ